MIESTNTADLTASVTDDEPLPVRWQAHRTDVSAANIKMNRENDPGPRLGDPDLLTSAHINGNVARFTLNLSGQADFLGDGPFRPTVRIVATPVSAAFSEEPQVWPYQQYCRWDDAITESPTSDGAYPGPSPSITSQPPAASAPGTDERGSTPQALPGPSAEPSLPDADAQGFVGQPGGRCRDADLAVAMGRTGKSLVVICQDGGGQLYYVGFGLQNGQPITVEKVLRYGNGYTVNNIDTQYTLTPDALEIDQGSSVLTREPMIEYWSR